MRFRRVLDDGDRDWFLEWRFFSMVHRDTGDGPCCSLWQVLPLLYKNTFSNVLVELATTSDEWPAQMSNRHRRASLSLLNGRRRRPWSRTQYLSWVRSTNETIAWELVEGTPSVSFQCIRISSPSRNSYVVRSENFQLMLNGFLRQPSPQLQVLLNLSINELFSTGSHAVAFSANTLVLDK